MIQIRCINDIKMIFFQRVLIIFLCRTILSKIYFYIIYLIQFRGRELMNPEEDGPKSNGKEAKNLLTSAESPWRLCPIEIQQLFQENEIGQLVFKGFGKKFQLQPTSLNMCVKVISEGNCVQKCYVCNTCFRQTNNHSFVLCEQCFELEKHKDHFYELLESSGQRLCDCGKIIGLQNKDAGEKTFCSKHCGKQKQIALTQNQKKLFIQYFEHLLKIMIFLDDSLSKFSRDLLQELMKLTENSRLYINLVTQLLGKDEGYILKKLMSNKFFLVSKYLLYNLFPSTNFGFLLGKTLHHIRQRRINSQNSKRQDNKESQKEVDNEMEKDIQKGSLQKQISPQIGYSILEDDNMIIEEQQEILKKLLINPQVVEKLSKQGIYFSYIPNVYGIYAFHEKEKGQQLFKDYLSYSLMRQTKEKGELIVFIIENFFQFLKYADGITVNFMLQNILYYFGEQQFEERDELDQSQIRFLVLQCFVQIYDGNLNNLQRCINGLSPTIKQYFERFLQSFFNCYNIINEGKQYFAVVLILILYSSHSQQLIERIWNNVITEKNNIFNALLQVTNIISHINLANFSNDQQKQNWLRSYLYTMKQLPLNRSMQLRSLGFFRFEKAGQIMKEVCTFVHDDSKFVYTSSQQYSHPSMLITVCSRLNEDMDNCALNYETQFDFKNEAQKQISKMLFNCPHFYKKIMEKWKIGLQQSQFNQRVMEQWKNNRLGDIMIFVMLIAYKFGQQNNKQIQQFLQQLRDNSQTRFTYQFMTSSPSTIHKLLSIKDSMMEGEEEEEKDKVLKMEELKEKGKSKKDKLRQKYKHNNTNVIQKLSSRAYSIRQDVDLCLTCHQKSREGNQLVYLGNIRKETICSSVYMEQNRVTDIKISSCFHTIHIDCFKEMGKQNTLNFQCPLCSKPGNCILPAYQQMLQQQVQLVCFNIINANYVYKYSQLKCQSLFNVLFLHILESKGLDSLINKERYQENAYSKDKLNNHIIAVMKAIYNSKSSEDKEKLQRSILKLQSRIVNKQQLMGLIQIHIIRVLSNYIFRDSLYESLSQLLIIKNTIVQPQFETLKTQIQAYYDLMSLEELSNHTQYGQQEVSFKILQIPKIAEDFVKLRSRLCEHCKEFGQDIVCMLCHKIYCINCEKKLHMNNHYRLIYLNFKSGQTSIIERGKHPTMSQISIGTYVNNFMISFRNYSQEYDEYDNSFRLYNRNYEYMKKQFFKD